MRCLLILAGLLGMAWSAGAATSGGPEPAPLSTLNLNGILHPSDTNTPIEFGYSVAISGYTVVVGARNAQGLGSAHVFVASPSGWRLQQVLRASNQGVSDEFGCSVAISGDTIVVGARREDSNATGVNGIQGNNSASEAGAAYVFVRSGGVWTQQAYLKADNTGAGDFFGYSVGISADTIVVGAEQEDSTATGVNGDGSNNGGLNPGAAYVFTRTEGTWSQQAYLKGQATGDNFYFGHSVAVSGDAVVVGSPQDGGGCGSTSLGPIKCGGAFVFERIEGSWMQTAWLTASNKESSDRFGEAVAIAGDTIVVGAYFEDSDANGVNGDQGDNSTGNAGAAYVFTRQDGGWAQEAYLKSRNSKSFRRFGTSVGTSGDKITVGCYYQDPAPFYERVEGEWVQRPDLLGDPRLEDNASLLSKTVGISTDLAAVGMSGTVFVFRTPLREALLLEIW